MVANSCPFLTSWPASTKMSQPPPPSSTVFKPRWTKRSSPSLVRMPISWLVGNKEVTVPFNGSVNQVAGRLNREALAQSLAGKNLIVNVLEREQPAWTGARTLLSRALLFSKSKILNINQPQNDTQTKICKRNHHCLVYHFDGSFTTCSR